MLEEEEHVLICSETSGTIFFSLAMVQSQIIRKKSEEICIGGGALQALKGSERWKIDGSYWKTSHVQVNVDSGIVTLAMFDAISATVLSSLRFDGPECVGSQNQKQYHDALNSFASVAFN